MDQDSFRRLLQTPHASTSASASRGSLLTSESKTKSKTVDTSQPTFKPRKVKKSTDLRYRDRAAERRTGEGNDYAQVEAILKDFEKRHIDSEDKAMVEEQRQYLGGDGDHSILVKGLDVALLEQNKARAALSTEDDDSLEQAFLEVNSEVSVPKKRTREDLIRELKEKRVQKSEPEGAERAKVSKTAEEEARLLEEAKKKGKFKPIGFKPIGTSEDTGKKKRPKSDGKEPEKKRRRKVNNEKANDITNGDNKMPRPTTIEEILPSKVSVTLEPEPESLPDDFDIFAGAGEYQGFDLDDDDDNNDDDDENEPQEPISNDPEGSKEILPGTGNITHRWIETEESGIPPVKLEVQPPIPTAPSLPPGLDERDEEEEVQPTRLVPLASSALPSIKEFLAMGDAAESQAKRKKRKEKKKDNDDTKKRTTEAKVDRDYKRLKNYTDKKAGLSN